MSAPDDVSKPAFPYHGLRQQNQGKPAGGRFDGAEKFLRQAGVHR